MPGITTIVVGIDFSSCSAAALREALRLARACGATVHPVHVLDTLVVLDAEESLSPMQQGIRDSLVADARAAWGGFAQGIPGAESLTLDVLINNRVMGIVRRVQELKAQLLVLGAYGDRRPEVGVGTIATGCVRRSTADVLLVRETHPGPFRTIVVGVDFSETSARAVQRAGVFASLDSGTLHVVHCFDAPWHHLHYKAPTPEADPSFQRQFRDTLRRRLEAFVASISPPLPADRMHTALHDARTHRSGLVHYAAQAKADLIVVGTRGRTNLRNVLLGSTAEKALIESRCSVLSVKPADTP
jgi:universal stress protein E